MATIPGRGRAGETLMAGVNSVSLRRDVRQYLLYYPKQTFVVLPVFWAFGFFRFCGVPQSPNGALDREVLRGVGAGTGLHIVSFLSCNFWVSPSIKMQIATVPFFDGEGESFLNNAQGAGFWNRSTTLDPANRASAFVLQMD